MSRVTAPVSKLSRALSSVPSAARSSSPLLDSTTHNGAGVALMPKYAELLRSRSSEHSDSSRGLTTNARPSAQPSIANRPRPLMQTFHSSASRSATVVPSLNLDAMVLPDLGGPVVVDTSSGLRMPLLPDNYGAAHVSEAAETSDMAQMPSIVAADPEKVAPSTPLSSVEGINLDGVELKFAHEGQQSVEAEADEHSHMLRDLWKGMVDDVLGPATRKSA